MVKPGFVGRAIALVSPVVVGSAWGIGAPATQAATFSFASSELLIESISLVPFDLQTVADSDTFTLAIDGDVSADANAVSEADESLFANRAFATTLGEGRIYRGSAFGIAGLLATFDIAANTEFSFSFFANLNVIKSVDRPQTELAEAFAELGLALIDSSDQEIGFFRLAGQVVSGDDDFLITEERGGFEFIEDLTEPTGDNSDAARAEVQGRFSRRFDQATQLRLVDAKVVESNVQSVPTPSTLLGTVVSGAWMMWKRRRQLKQEEQTSLES